MRQNLLKNLLAVMFLVLSTGFALSQGVTTSGISGVVSETNGQPLPGANVVATHLPSGTRYGGVSNLDGKFTIPGMRVGGPYRISVSFIGFSTQEVDGIILSLGVFANVNVSLQEDGQELSEVVVTSSKNNLFSNERTGANTSIDNQALTRLPTISRNINDFTRLTPQSNGQSFAGQDSRLNNITVDGSYFNNSFGLGSGSNPGGRTGVSPISLDAIEQISVNVAPYDVRQGNFTGAGVNTVTKSGTNEYSGSAYYFFRNNNNVGTQAGENTFNPGDFTYKQIGFRVGGPIIKDKLFFFASFEDEKEARPGTTWRANRGEAIEGNVTRVLASDLDQLSGFLRDKFNYETGPYQDYDNETLGTKFLVKLDYNINDKNKLSLRYNHLNSSTDVLMSNSSSLGFGSRNGRPEALNFQNSNYSINENIRSFVAELNSRLRTNMTNSLIVGYTYQDESRGAKGAFFPMVDILQEGATYTSFGFEPFTPNNELRYKTFQIQDNLQIFAGKHTFTLGFSYERYESENVFFPGSQSVYTYNSMDDFYKDANNFLANGNTVPSNVNLRRFQVRWNNIPGSEKPVQPLKVDYVGFYAQDEIQVRSNLKTTFGLRIDVPFFEETALRNEDVEKLFFRNPASAFVNFKTNQLPDPNILWSPRVGFNWDVFSNQKTQVRGGTGIFTGRPAYVWISNQVGNNGILTGFAQFDNSTARPFNPDPNAYKPAEVSGTPASSYELALTETDFKFPQVWRTNIGVDQQLPAGIVATGEFIYSSDVNGVDYYNGNLPVHQSQFVGKDNRPRYTRNRINNNIPNAIVLSNQAIGNSWVASFSLEKPFGNGLYVKGAYSYGETRNTVDPGSIAAGTWFNNPVSRDPNNPGLGISGNNLGHRVFGVISYNKDIFKFGNTSVSLFWESITIGNGSYRFAGDMNGDAGTSNDLIYIHANKAEMNFQQYTVNVGGQPVTFTAQQQADAWEAYIMQDKYLSANRGKYAERGGAIMPMVSRADFSFAQQLFTNINGKRNTLEFRVDILNVGNLLNPDWGQGKTFNSTQPLVVPANNQGGPADAQGVSQYRLRNFGADLISETYRPTAGVPDVWRMQFGLRYIFN
ncbi:TonB-dependent Receptor Plug Domain [Algoriphagus alkaliphilus]|uniref:TonB-dependent Receptor Plug Domain n=1 Tax=Algoriphagus alkaliphilus TaxID=279824 RepID=A0A1G5Z300_9BACT|nr:carboxypeptidase regulatory-like domain-containing protein [Algoriphagus alkaliphilus]SDA89459.1 TonB-dependent Receptor Plug Domain [Algoriphagus alkaliphilus]